MNVLKIAAVTATLALGATAAFAQSSPFGTWTRPSNGTKVDFYDCGGKLCAKVISSKTAGAAGKVIMTGAAKTGANTWAGDLLNVEDGKTYSGKVTLEGPKGLNLQGCTAVVFCKDETWVR